MATAVPVDELINAIAARADYLLSNLAWGTQIVASKSTLHKNAVDASSLNTRCETLTMAFSAGRAP